MNALKNIDDFQKRILNRIMDNYTKYNCGFSGPAAIDESCMFVSFLMYDILNEGVYVSEMYISTYKDSSQVNFEIVFDTPQMEVDGISDSKEYIHIYVQIAKLKLIRLLDFLYQLFNHGFIVFSDEEELDTDITEWASADYKLCKTKGFSVEIFSFSSSILKSFVNKYYNAAIIPTSTLIEFIKNDFLWEEQIQFKKNQRLSITAIIAAFIIGLGSPVLMTKCSTSTIKPEQIQSIINAIPEQVDEVKLKQEQIDSIISAIKNKPQYNGQTENEKP